MKVTVFQAYLEGMEDEDNSVTSPGHLTSEQVAATGRELGGIGDGGYLDMAISGGNGDWKIIYYKWRDEDPDNLETTAPVPEVDIFDIDRHGDVSGVDDEGFGDLMYHVYWSESDLFPADPTAVSDQMGL